MKVQGRLMQVRFIEIHQVFPKKRSDTIDLSKWCIVLQTDSYNM